MSEVSAISGATGENLEKLKEQAEKLGKTTKFSATQAAEGYKYMAMAGWETEDMLAGLPGILDLAAASGEDLGTTSDIVTDVLTAMGKSASEAGHFADVLAVASSSSNTNVGMMGETFKYVAPVAGALGFEIEDLSQAIGLMANSSIKGSQAGTSLRSILTRLSTQPKDCAEAMEEYGIAITDGKGKMKSLYDIMQNLRESLGGLSEDEQTSAASAIAGQEAMSGLLAIVNASDEDFQDLADNIANSSGAAENMADTMQDNLQGKLINLQSALEGVGISAYEKFEEPLKKAVDKVIDAVSNFDLDDFIDKVKEVIKTVKKISPVIAAVVSAIGGIYATFKAMKLYDTITKVVGTIKAARGFLSVLGGPIGIIVGLIAAVIAGLVTLYATNEDFRNKVNSVLDAISEKIQSVVEFFKPYVEEAIKFVQQCIEDVVESLKPVIESIGHAFEAAWNLIKAIWEKVAPYFQEKWELIKAIFSVVAPVLGGFFSAAWEWIKAVWGTVTGFFSAIWETIATIFEVVEDVLSGDFSSAWEAIKRVLSVWKEFFKEKYEDLCAAFDGVVDFFTDTGKSIVDAIGEGIKAAWDGLKSIVQELWDSLKSIFTIKKSDIKVEGSGSSHAGGLDYVPYNNYSANLHRGEMVLTADEADRYRRGFARSGGNFTVNQTIYAAEQSAVELSASTAAAFQRARWLL